MFHNTLKGSFKVFLDICFEFKDLMRLFSCPFETVHLCGHLPDLPTNRLTHLRWRRNQLCSFGLNCGPFSDKFDFPFNQTTLITFACPVSSLKKKIQSNKSSKTATV